MVLNRSDQTRNIRWTLTSTGSLKCTPIRRYLIHRVHKTISQSFFFCYNFKICSGERARQQLADFRVLTLCSPSREIIGTRHSVGVRTHCIVPAVPYNSYRTILSRVRATVPWYVVLATERSPRIVDNNNRRNTGKPQTSIDAADHAEYCYYWNYPTSVK